jgi:3'(2'), 5'-bisphosphate nucleotidase
VVALALIEAGQVVLGALGCPNLDPDVHSAGAGAGAALLAARGAGSWSGELDGGDLKRLTVSQRSEVSQARLLRSVESGHTDVEKMARFVAALGTEEPPVLMDSQAKFALLAAGRAELIVRMVTPDRPDYAEHIWDQAAGSIIVQEAGGRVTDLRGEELDFLAGKRLVNNIGVLVSNGELHSAALRALSQVGADKRPAAGG